MYSQQPDRCRAAGHIAHARVPPRANGEPVCPHCLDEGCRWCEQKTTDISDVVYPDLI
jgi:hypothetical protein